MNSWQLFKHLTPFRASDVEYTPVFRRERQQTPIWHLFPLPRLAGQANLSVLALIVTVYVLALVLISDPLALTCMTNLVLLPVLLLPSLALWTVPLGLALAPVIVRERVLHTWQTLRITPLDTQTLVLSKARAALLRLNGFMVLSRAAMLVAAIMVSAISLNVISRLSEGYLDRLPPLQACGLGALIMALAGLTFLLDRAQQFTLMALSALAAGASGSSIRIALPGAIVAALLAWMIDIGMAVALIALDPAGSSMSLLSHLRLLVMFGPVAAYLSEFAPLHAALFIVITLVVRELAVRLLWRGTLHIAQMA